MRWVNCADMRSTRGEGEATEVQNINSQSGNEQSEGSGRRWLPVINTGWMVLVQGGACRIRARGRARRCLQKARRVRLNALRGASSGKSRSERGEQRETEL